MDPPSPLNLEFHSLTGEKLFRWVSILKNGNSDSEKDVIRCNDNDNDVMKAI
jgi:hypothetical protein